MGQYTYYRWSFFLFLSSRKHRCVSSGNSYERTNTKYTKKFILKIFSSKGFIKLQFLLSTRIVRNTLKLEICKSDIDNFNPNGILLLWNNDWKHKSEMSLDYYIENKIQLLEWPAYCPDLNLIENIWAILRISWEVMYIKRTLKSDIEEYWISCATHLSSIIGDSIRKRIYT